MGLAGEIRGLGRGVLTLVGDVSRAADAQRFVAESLGRFGRIDVLVNGLTQAMAQELAPLGITVNAICPGSVAGP